MRIGTGQLGSGLPQFNVHRPCGWLPCHGWSSCRDFPRVLWRHSRLLFLRMTATGLRLSRCHRPILDAFILSAALAVGLRCGRRLNLLSDTRAGGECEEESKRNAEA